MAGFDNNVEDGTYGALRVDNAVEKASKKHGRNQDADFDHLIDYCKTLGMNNIGNHLA